ncbi:CBS domain-containing protein [Rhodobacteraceae bacterium 2CG4]|uniref:CBS domain-containing protein n=1 Tax=Halovulum marinum TaxID=2662447 RepID=A0A6L5Z8T4_9RHOB|nr:hemolysin family protein [Halovulum marinum]MSU92302.1 CBS domain-containing protein [Halovulum marinum]
MGDNTDGSSSAAQGAPLEDQEQAGSRLQFLNRLLGLRPEEAGSDDQDHEVTMSESGSAHAMLLNVRRMRDVRVQDVAVPRADVVGVPETAPLDEVVTVFRDSTFTRLPVFNETLDSPLGFVHLKDVALRFGFNGHDDSFNVKDLLRPLLYVPPSMPMSVLLQKMQTERIHMALVIDEYGGVDGLVTIEDLVEQIVGEIEDEHDTEDAAYWIEEAPGVYLCSARAPLHDFEQLASVDLLADELDEDVDTLGGLVFMLAGRVPLRGEVIPHPQGHEFEVVDADPRTVKRIRVRLRPGAILDRAAE